MAKSEILGIGELSQSFRELKSDMETRTARAMVVAAGGVLKRKAKSIAQANGSVRTGAMIKNIAIKREPQAPAGTAQYHLGVRSGGDLTRKQKKAGKRLVVRKNGRIGVQYQDNPYYWKWVELGHNITPREAVPDGSTTYQQRLRNGKVVTRTKKNVGTSIRQRRKNQTQAVAAKPFIAPALEQGKTEAIDAMATRLQKELEKASKP